MVPDTKGPRTASGIAGSYHAGTTLPGQACRRIGEPGLRLPQRFAHCHRSWAALLPRCREMPLDESKEERGVMKRVSLLGALCLVACAPGVRPPESVSSAASRSVAADVREGTRYAVVRGTTSGRVATAESHAAYVRTRTSLDTAGLRVYTSWSPNKRPGSIVTGRVAHNVPRRGPFIPAHIDSATSKMVILF